MDRNEISKNASSILDTIKTVDGSLIKEFIDLQPESDLEYVRSWFYYMKFLTKKSDLIDDLIFNASESEKAILSHELRMTIEALFQQELNKKMEKLSFEPRLERYVEEFHADERNNIRLIILAVLWLIKNDDLRLSNLLGLASQFDLSETFIFTLNANHRLFTDKVLNLEKDSILSRDFFSRDLHVNPLIFNIFTDLPIGEMDIQSIGDSPIALFFNIVTPEDFDQFSSIEEEFTDDLEDDSWDEDIDTNFENIISSFSEKQIETPDIELDEINSEEQVEQDSSSEEYTIYKTDAEFFLAEFEYYSLLAKKSNPTYEESEEDRRNYPKLAKKLRNKCDFQLKQSIKAGFTPRFETLAKDLKLSAFEKDVLKCLVSFNVFRLSIGSDLTIGEVLKMLDDSPLKHLENKKYFKKSAKLIKSGVVHVEDSWDLDTSLYENQIRVDSRLVELLSGASFDISEYIEGTFLYSSGIKMKNVILPDEDKNKIMELIKNFDRIQSARKYVEFDKHFEYGNALVMLFTGPSGTGKTMLANAISNELGKKILLFNLNNLEQMASVDNAAVFQTLFREARLNNAILFFDESEAILSNRINDLLIEIERHNGIVIFATNANFEIDPAMRRRILHFTNFQDPGANLRREIWKVHLYDFPKKLKLAEDVNLDLLASKFEISGGLIKNAIFTALVKAVNDSDDIRPIIKMNHLMEGAKEQLENKYFMSKMEKVRIPHKGLEAVVVPDKIRETIIEIINFEKARKVLEGQWGFSQVFPDKNGVAVLFYGPPGTGKTLTAEAIAYETGKTLKQVNYAQIVSKYVGETEKALEALFTELSDNKSILLFDEADALFAKRSAVLGSNSRYLNMETDLLLSLIERNNVFAILTTNNLENIDDAFYRRMTYIVNFKKPEFELRRKLWQTLIPKKLPIKGKINFDLLAEKYELTGAEIKNVVIRTATRKAVNLGHDDGICTEDLIEGCESIVKPDDMIHKKIGF